MEKDIQNPWAGLASYEDPDTAERKLKFCGRDDDSYDLAHLIMGNVFVTLYGKSGIGKTSLLNAGVFPELREEQYTPVSIRLGMRDEEHPQSYQTMIVEIVERVVNKVETIDIIVEQQDRQSIDYLWNYFARHRFYDRNDEPTTPVIVLDQFEEVFRFYRHEAETLLRQLDYLNDKDHTLDSCEVDGQPYRYEQNFRFVVSIREDDLYRLEDSIDNCFLPALKRCRYRLRSLSVQGARDVILIPGEGLFNADEKDSIVDSIISKSQNDDESISTNIISLLCSRIYVDFKKSGADHILPSLVENFIKGNPFERFYSEATQGFSNKEKSYIEEHFVDSTGRRNIVPESDFLLHVKNGSQLLEGKNRILQRISISSGSKTNRVELIHDSFCEPLEEIKQRRNRLRKAISLSGIVLAIVLLIAILSYIQSINKTNEILEKGMSIIRIEKADLLTDEGDSYKARVLLLAAVYDEGIGEDYDKCTEAEVALRKAYLRDDALMYGHKRKIYKVSFSPDGKKIASCSEDSCVKIWDTMSGGELLSLSGKYGIVSTLSFSPDSKTLVTACTDHTIRFWDANSGMELDVINIEKSNVFSLCYSKDEKKILIARNDSLIELDLQSKKKQYFIGHHGTINNARYSQDGKMVVSASDDGTVKIWNAIDASLVKSFSISPEESIMSVAFSNDNQFIYSGIWNVGIRKWSVNSGKPVAFYPFIGISYLDISPNGQWLAVSGTGDDIKILDSSNLEPKDEYESPGITTSVAFNPNGNRIAYSSWNGAIVLKSLKKYKGDQTDVINMDTDCLSAIYSPDGNSLAISKTDGTISVWDNLNKKERIVLHAHNSAICGLAYSNDGHRLASSSLDSTVKIWNTQTWELLAILKGHKGKMNSVKISHNNKIVASSGQDGCIKIWSAETGKLLHTLEGYKSTFTQVDFSNDDIYLVYCSQGYNTIKVWNLSSMKIEYEIKDENDFMDVRYSTDGKLIASASLNGVIKIWDATNGKLVKELVGHNGVVSGLSFSIDDKYLASASWDQTIRVWSIEIGSLAALFRGHKSEAISVCFSPDGNKIVSTGNLDKTIRIWDFPPLQQLIDSTRERFKNRQLTPEELREFYLE